MNDPSTREPPDLFAAYEPHPRHVLPKLSNVVIRPSQLSDRDPLARIAQQRNGGKLSEYLSRFDRDLTNSPRSPDDLWLTAEVNGAPVGYGKVSLIVPAIEAPPNHAPHGYYLGGVSVAPEWRRRGIGIELTRRRVEWISQRAPEAFYFANVRNRASIDLHAKVGFVELTRDFYLPGASFVGGIGVLFRLTFGSDPMSSDNIVTLETIK